MKNFLLISLTLAMSGCAIRVAPVGRVVTDPKSGAVTMNPDLRQPDQDPSLGQVIGSGLEVAAPFLGGFGAVATLAAAMLKKRKDQVADTLANVVSAIDEYKQCRPDETDALHKALRNNLDDSDKREVHLARAD